MPETVSLHSFCKAHGNLPKTSVRRWLNDHGYDTSAGLSPVAVTAAKAQFCPPAVPPAPAAGGLSIHGGNHCTTLAAPGFGGMTIDLGQFRDSSALVIDDPLAVAEQFLQTADLIQGALADDIAAREQRLQSTKQAQAKVAAKAQQLALEQRLYRLQTSQLDAATTEETTALADALAQLQSLGKPAADG
ncbi:hypothetical protein VB780_08115 [Leptolyngbya sp. CCNP1308]|uniref:hypothetical protein n=1 Tax=Leptolyngbya sp. CCNP1308 TaxID=3110255 RepID=UPI002B1F03BC|nr:hypothetical protein [Leptolyngbya sp. CCNP1308]MEA5448526.1 hypothetical protein [Leptolyngbya sp. CCNP1308]